ncbi:MAG: histidine phosphatase family protein, partial [Candidatus Aenigmarchaeota archaeon]|nr:histidine phosphatase family protein [Candidatus Aenigmarchaeota archaeon]
DYGIFDGKPISVIAKERRKIKMPRYKFKPQKGESYEDLKTRIEPFIEKLANEDKTFLLVTHGDVIRIISYILLNKPVQNLARMRFKCASINIFEPKNGKFILKKQTKHLN